MLNFQNISKTYVSICAVDDLTLEIKKGEVFGLLGPNGAGKTTTISMAVGLVDPDRGTIQINGEGSPTDPAVRKGLGVAPQALALYDDLTARENLLLFGRLYGLAGAELHNAVMRVLEFVTLSDRAGDRVGGFSGGMKRRLNLACAIIHEPDITLMDEPTAGVDPQSRNAIFQLVTDLRERGCTVIYTTHYMEEAERLCDRVAIMDQGKVIALDTVDNLIKAHGGQAELTIRTSQNQRVIQTDDPLSDLARLMAGDGSDRPTSFTLDRPSLESVFLNLTGRSLRD